MESAIITVVKEILPWCGINEISVVGLRLNLWEFS